jgi:hypothetical protein
MKSLKRVFISFPYIKHTNNNVNILIFIFNKYKLLLLNKIKKLNRLFYIYKNKINKHKNSMVKFNKKFNKKFKNYNNSTNGYKKFNEYRKSNKHNKYINKKIINVNIKNEKKLNFLENSLNKKPKLNLNNLINFKNFMVNSILHRKKKNIFKKNYISSLYLNVFKYNNLNLINVKNIIYKIFNKKVNINIIDMKYLYLDNSNLIQAITRKLNDRKKKVLKVLKKTLKLIKLAKFLKITNKFSNINIHYLKNIMYIKAKSIYSNIIKNLKNKHLIGIFLEAKGRLTRRMTASRAVYKLRYKGNMKNPYSINKTTKLSRGYIKPNVIINKNNSYNKNGSFGITSKVNTY